jgi:hypothetical protein
MGDEAIRCFGLYTEFMTMGWGHGVVSDTSELLALENPRALICLTEKWDS